MPDHPGFDYWKTDDGAHPYPFAPIDVRHSSESWIEGEVDMALPIAIPEKKTAAETSVGINLLGELNFGMRCTRLPNGKIDILGVMSASHGHHFPAHGETESGKEHMFLIPNAEIRQGGSREALIPHGPHCDVIKVDWHRRKGGIRIRLDVFHMTMTPEELIETRKRNLRKAKRRPRIDMPLPQFPLKELKDKKAKPDETPKPKPPETPKQPGPVGMGKRGIGAALAGVLERMAGWLRG